MKYHGFTGSARIMLTQGSLRLFQLRGPNNISRKTHQQVLKKTQIKILTYPGSAYNRALKNPTQELRL